MNITEKLGGGGGATSRIHFVRRWGFPVQNDKKDLEPSSTGSKKKERKKDLVKIHNLIHICEHYWKGKPSLVAEKIGNCCRES